MPPDAAWAQDELRALVVDDEPDVRLGLKMLAESLRADVRDAASGEEALEIAGRWRPHLVVSDITMGGMSGMDLLDEIRREHPETQVVLVTGFGTIAMAVSAMARGAAHFVTKPFDNEEMLRAMRRFGQQALLDERVRMLTHGEPDEAGVKIVAESGRMRSVLERIAQVAPTAMSVLIRGESGVGKEIVARAIHGSGENAKRPFLAVNAAALPDSLLESELFGHKRGAFTGAERDRSGIFEEARGGTVFLDEIGLMSPSFQGKLLRVLQERTVVPLGTTEPVPVDFRLVAATSQRLLGGREGGVFREDLYYRLRVVTVDIPPLRDRREDIAPLAAHFLSKYESLVSKAGRLTPGALGELQHYAWPGNVRELENCIQRALVLSGGRPIEPVHLGLHDDDDEWRGAVQVEPGLNYEEGKQRAVQAFQRRFIERALSESGGNVSQAARTCGLTRAALQRIMKSLGLDRSQFS